MKRARLILNAIVILLLILQLLGYLGTQGKETTNAKGIDLAAYYFGFNLPGIIAVILFAVAQLLKKRISKKEETNIIDSLGND